MSNIKETSDQTAPETTPAAIADALRNIKFVMDDLLIFAATLKGSECEIARGVGVRLGIGGTHNLLDLAHEALERPRPPRAVAQQVALEKTKIAPEVVEAIARQRSRLFEAIAFVDTTADSLDEGDVSQRATLRAAYRLLDDIAEKLELVGSYGTDRDNEDEGGEKS